MTSRSSGLVLAILQARLSSSRLPGKVLRPLLGKPMLARQIERLNRSHLISKLMVATSVEPDDDQIERLCGEIGVSCSCGSLTDVLDRYYQAARPHNPDLIIRLTGDCPLADPELIDLGITYFQKHSYDYISNVSPRTYPIGLDFEVFTFEALGRAWREAALPSEREHVTPYIRNHPELFAIGNLAGDADLSHHRWTVDEPADFEFVTNIYESLYPNDPAFTTSDILRLLAKRPELTSINYHITHGAGYRKSLQEDAQFLAAKEKENRGR